MRDLGIFAWFGCNLPLADRFKLIADAGFQSTCLWFGAEEELVASGNAGEMVGLAKSEGLKIDNVHAPYIHSNCLWSTSDREIDSVTSDYASAVRFCAKYHIPHCVIHITKGANPPPMREGGLNTINGLLQIAEASNVVLAIENTGRPDYLDYVFSNIDSRHLGFCYDSSHDFLPGKSRGEILKKWSELLVAVHLSDNRGETDDHALPGDATIDWDAIEAGFPKDRYNGVIMLEVVPQGSGETAPKEFLAAAYERAQCIEAKLANKPLETIPNGLSQF